MSDNNGGDIYGLVGDYCDDCNKSLRLHVLAVHSIVPMCREDLNKILSNGDLARIEKMLRRTRGGMTSGDNIDGDKFFKGGTDGE